MINLYQTVMRARFQQDLLIIRMRDPRLDGDAYVGTLEEFEETHSLADVGNLWGNNLEGYKLVDEEYVFKFTWGYRS